MLYGRLPVESSDLSSIYLSVESVIKDIVTRNIMGASLIMIAFKGFTSLLRVLKARSNQLSTLNFTYDFDFRSAKYEF